MGKPKAAAAHEASLSKAGFAKRAGIARSTLTAWLADGKIPVNTDGTIPTHRGLAAARAHLRGGAPEATSKTAELRLANLDAQVRERTAKAAGRELEVAQARGDLVPRSEVEADARAAMEAVRARLLAIPGRVALVLEAIAAGPAPRAPLIEAKVADEINAALEALNSTRFGQAATEE